MVTKVEACVECAQKCLLVHGNKNKASPAASFFKVMIGDQYSKVLFLPPKFAPTVSALVDQKTVLEDSHGLQWKVRISRIDGSLAFKQGWNAFSLDHDLQVGEFLVFNCVMSSHFVVKMYDKSGCEKLKFPEIRFQKKRTQDNRNSTIQEGPCEKIVKNSMNKQGSNAPIVSRSDAEKSQCLYGMSDMGKAPNVMNKRGSSTPFVSRSDAEKNQCLYGMSDMRKAPNVTNKQGSSTPFVPHSDAEKPQFLYGMSEMEKAPNVMENASNCANNNEKSIKKEYVDEMIYMMDRKFGEKYEEERTCIFDLFNFEMLEMNSDTGGNNKVAAMDETFSHNDDSSLRLQNVAGSVDIIPAAKEAINSAIPSEASKFDRTEQPNYSEDKVKKASPSDEDSCTNKTSGPLFPAAAVNPEEDEENISKISNRAPKKCLTTVGSESLSGHDQVAVSEKENDLIKDSFQSANEEFTGISESFDEMTKTVKEEELTSVPCSQNIIPFKYGEPSNVVNTVCSQISNMIIRETSMVIPVVKSEPVDPDETLPCSSKFSCLVAAGSQPFLELPVSLPLPKTRQSRGRRKMDRRIVFLRDPVMRLWPVLYIDKFDFRILTSGWEAFSKANNLQPEDACAIGIENESEGILSVQIIRK